MMKHPCLVCGVPTTGPRCQTHALRPTDLRSTEEKGLGSAHRRIAAQTLREEKLCWLCHKGPTITDPLEADHIIPRSKGGTTTRANYHAAHRSCNRGRGNREPSDKAGDTWSPPNLAIAPGSTTRVLSPATQGIRARGRWARPHAPAFYGLPVARNRACGGGGPKSSPPRHRTSVALLPRRERVTNPSDLASFPNLPILARNLAMAV